MVLADSVAVLKGVGPETAKLFHKIGIDTISDLVNYFPRKYNDYSNVTSIEGVQPGNVSLKVKFSHITSKYVRAGLHITQAVAYDTSGRLKVVWFNQPYRLKNIDPKQFYFLAGILEFSGRGFSIINPSIELVNHLPNHTARIVPVYKETKGLTSTIIRKAVNQCTGIITNYEDTLPDIVQRKYKLMKIEEAIKNIHFPTDSSNLEKARYKLAFNELFELIITGMFTKSSIQEYIAPKIIFKKKVVQDILAALPYQLTNAQKKTIWDILKDIDKSKPMNRLVEGDVGSGKTVVAAIASAMAIESNYQVAYMAPTELLATQHAATFKEIFSAIHKESKVCLLTGGITASKKKHIYKEIQEGKYLCVIGTHALIQEKMSFKNLGLVIIDEQHRFGVNQRKQLLDKSNKMPHMLTMTATPIPRSLALVVYGELDVSLINEKPNNRVETQTAIVPLSERSSFYASLKKLIAKGEKCFVVCPLIDENDTINARSANTVFKELSAIIGPGQVSMLHGKMKADAKLDILQKFRESKTKLIVSTTVVEVGVDIPDANIMVIESVERYGLAQIHQLRGRVGRGGKQGKCFLIQSQPGIVSPRIKAILSTSNGFELAELDLKLRGPGAMYGIFQHGKIDLRIADFTDRAMVETVKKAAALVMSEGENLVQYPELLTRISKLQSITNLN